MLGWVGRLSIPAVSKDLTHLKGLKGVNASQSMSIIIDIEQ